MMAPFFVFVSELLIVALRSVFRFALFVVRERMEGMRGKAKRIVLLVFTSQWMHVDLETLM